MIFAALQQAVAAVANADAFFTTPPGCRVYWQGEKEKETGHALDTAKAIQSDLSNAGVAASVPEPAVGQLDDTFATVIVTIVFFENIEQNRSSAGTGKTAYDFAVKAFALLWGQQLGTWGQLMFEGLDPIDIDAEGCNAWALKFRTQTLLDLIVPVLSDDAGNSIVTESGDQILITPTDP